MDKQRVDKEISRIIESRENILSPYRKTEIIHNVMHRLKIPDKGKTFFDIADRIEVVSKKKGYKTIMIDGKKLRKVM